MLISMKTLNKKSLLSITGALFILILFSSTLPLAADDPTQTGEPLQVATKPFGPFVIKLRFASGHSKAARCSRGCKPASIAR